MSRIRKAAKLGRSGLLLGIATAATTTVFGAQAVSAAVSYGDDHQCDDKQSSYSDSYDHEESDGHGWSATDSDEGQMAQEEADDQEGAKADDSKAADDSLIWEGAAAAEENNWTQEDTDAIKAWKAENPEAVAAWQAAHPDGEDYSKTDEYTGSKADEQADDQEGAKADDSEAADDSLIWPGVAAAEKNNWKQEDTDAIEAWKAENPEAVQAWQTEHEDGGDSSE